MRSVKCVSVLLAAGVVAALGVCAWGQAATEPAPAGVSQAPAETPEQKDARMQWWRQARFGMFIHWGIYSVPAGTYDGKQIPSLGEWIMNNGEIPVATYAGYAGEFDPVKFNAEEWVSLAKAAGMKYMIMTAKHHDGFAMFKSRDPFNIVDATPFHRDPIKELSEAAAKQGIKFGVYYSQDQDWHHPGGDAIRRNNRKTDHWDAAQDGDFDEYLKTVAAPQVRELLTQYHPAVLWWDTPKWMTPARAALFTPLLALDPGVITNNRLGGGAEGDTETPEQYVPPTGFPGGRDWETCMTINDTWGYKSYDGHFKSTEALLHDLIDAASKGGNFLLNVGPTSEGVIPAPEAERLRAMGTWLDVNGEAIYGTTASPFKAQPWGRATKVAAADKSGTTIYLHVFDWPKDGELDVPITNAVTDVHLLADAGRKVWASADEEAGTIVHVTGDAPDALASVVVLKVEGTPTVIHPPEKPNADGTLSLSPLDARVPMATEKPGRSETSRRQPILTDWSGPNAEAQWTIRLPAAGKYEATVQASYARAEGAGTAPAGEAAPLKEVGFTLSAGEGSAPVTIKATRSGTSFSASTSATLALPAGKFNVTLRPSEALPAGVPVSVSEVRLRPAP
ncbi:MAG TPA: alpha-L-fucosidase [Phycisphaerae bacterium]|nr:alpha-L-fucosidase [Phycisphaerae bacterium]